MARFRTFSAVPAKVKLYHAEGVADMVKHAASLSREGLFFVNF
jgi:hypothetical protein